MGWRRVDGSDSSGCGRWGSNGGDVGVEVDGVGEDSGGGYGGGEDQENIDVVGSAGEHERIMGRNNS